MNAALLLSAALVALAYPLYRAQTERAALSVSTLDDLLAQRDGVYATLRDLPALRRGAVAVFGGAGLAAVLLSPRLVVAAAVPVVAVLGWLHPELWLHSRARRRAAQIEDQAPLVLDLVAVSVSAGATVGAALDGAGAVAAEPLRAELRRLAASMALGDRPPRARARSGRAGRRGRPPDPARGRVPVGACGAAARDHRGGAVRGRLPARRRLTSGTDPAPIRGHPSPDRS